MASYKDMYYHLFNKITGAVTLLQAAQAETEEMYVKQEDTDIFLLHHPADED